MKIIASRHPLRLAVGLLGYVAVLPMLLLIAGGYGATLGFTMGDGVGVDPSRAMAVTGYGALFLAGPVLVFSLAREAWARVFREVRLSKEYFEFDRLGTTFSWKLDELRALRVTVQSTAVHHVAVTEIAFGLTGPDGRRLHLTDLTTEAARELIPLASAQMADGMSRRLSKEPLRFGPSFASYLDIYNLGPPMLWTPLLAAFDLAWLGILLSVLYFAYLAWKMREATAMVTSSGLRRPNGQEILWTDIKAVNTNFDFVEVVTASRSFKIRGPENIMPLGELIDRQIASAAAEIV